jgi:diguanylate cyclase (GGDEF)-like protein
LLASSDSLTGCLNRRTFFERAERLLADAAAARRPLSFVMVDADHFKTVNDRFGHLVGDNVLVSLANLLREFCVAPHLLGRYGGEEFCLVITGLNEAVVAQRLERIRFAVSDVRTWLPSGEPTTVSIGMTSLGEQPCTLADLVKRADAALYAAKSGGRNRVVNWRDIAQDVQPRETDRPVLAR